MKTYLRKISLFLAILLASTSVACGSASTTSNDTTTAPADTTTAEPVDDRTVKDDLPERNFNGETITLLAREEFGFEFDAEQTGDVVDDAVYTRNQTISERFNVNLEYVTAPGLWASKSSYQSIITSAILAGDDSYDIVTGQSNIVLPLAVQGVFHNIADSEYIDFEKPYWKSGYHDNATINGKLYSLCGDYALSTLTASNVIFFNMAVLDDHQIEYPYEMVKSGDWTLDEYIKLASQFSRDLNGDGQMTEVDMYGLITDTNGINPFQYATECSLTAPGDDGVHVVDFPSEKEIDVFDKLLTFCLSPSFRFNDKMTTEYSMIEAFIAGTTATISGTLKNVEKLRDMESDFGIVPYPKYDKTQEEYVTSILRTVTVASIPTTVENYDDCCFLLEAMAAEGYNNIIPAYYEIALKGKYTRDTDTAEMLDIISTTGYFAFADVFYAELGSNSDMLGNYIKAGTQGLASYFASRSSTIEQKLIDLYEAYSD